MKWFKHDSNAQADAKLERLIIRHGLEGYGLYWYCLELIVGNIEAHNLTFKQLQHHYDTTIGLWCIDKDPIDVDIEWIRDNAFKLTPMEESKDKKK